MGLMDNIRGFFSKSKNNQDSQPQINEIYEKNKIANKIVSLVDEIKSVNSLDSSIWNLSNISTYELYNRSLEDLKHLQSSLEIRLSQLTRQRKTGDTQRETLEEAKWTGQKPKDMSNRDFDRLQRDDR